jgi:uncharacterized protein with gpF-like domain
MLTRPEVKGKRLRAVHPNIGIEIEYRHQLQALVESMHHSLRYWLECAYRNNQPILAQDSPASAIKSIFNGVARRWRRTWNAAAQKLAGYFSRQVQERSDTNLQRILRDNGLNVQFTMTEAMRDVFHAVVAQNVSLIKSIPQTYLADVEQAVMRTVQVGGDLEGLTRELEKRYGITHRRAAFIAKSQNEMATASMTRVRQIELGMTEAIWIHSDFVKEPRPTHVAMHMKRYDPKQGMWDSHEKKWVLPGQLPNCQCRSQSVIN